MTGSLLGIENDRANWSLEVLGSAPIALLWRTDGPGHHIVVCNLNGWHVGLYTAVEVGVGEHTIVCAYCAEQLPATAETGEECPECGAPGEPSKIWTEPAATLAVPVQVALGVDPADVAVRVEAFQRTSESIQEPAHDR